MSLVSWRQPGTRTAAAALLDRVIGEERDRLTLSVCRARSGLAALNLIGILPTWGVTPEEMGYSSATPSLVGAGAYLAMSALVLAHPNIVQVYDFGVHEQRYFLAMEYVDGAPLSKALKALVAEGRLPSLPALVYLTHEIASALDDVAGLRTDDDRPLGLVHRDLNPPNVLLSRAGEVKVADFGIARVGNQPGITETGVMRGKRVYASPEQLQGEPLDVQTDRYALGLSLLEVASGRRVIQGANDLELATAALQQPIPRLAALRPDAPPALDEALARLTECDRARRTKTPRELLDAIAPLARALNALELGRKEWAQVVPLVQTATHALAPLPLDREAETKTSPAHR